MISPIPEKWCILITKENLEEIGNWYNINCNADCYTKTYQIGEYYTSHTQNEANIKISLGCNIANCIISWPTKEYPEITFEEFKKYVLNQEKMLPLDNEIKLDLSYLKPLLKQLNIQ